MKELKGESGFNPLMEGSSFGPSYVIWMIFLGLQGCAVWPTTVARTLACESESVVRKQFMVSSISFTLRCIVPMFWGICAYVFIKTQAPDMQAVFFPEGGEGEAVSSLYAMPVFLGRILPIGLIGLITAAMIAAFMSTHDSYFLCWSSVITNDIIVPLAGDLSQRAQVRITRILIVLMGIFIFTFSYLYPLGQRLWDYMAVSGAIYFTGAFSVLFFGLYWKRASWLGAVLAMLGGCVAIVGLDPIKYFLVIDILGKPETALELVTGAEIGLLAVMAGIMGMIVGSLIVPHKDVEPGVTI